MAVAASKDNNAGTSPIAANSNHLSPFRKTLFLPLALIPEDRRVAFIRLILATIAKVIKDVVSALLAVLLRNGALIMWWMAMKSHALAIKKNRIIALGMKEWNVRRMSRRPIITLSQ